MKHCVRYMSYDENRKLMLTIGPDHIIKVWSMKGILWRYSELKSEKKCNFGKITLYLPKTLKQDFLNFFQRAILVYGVKKILKNRLILAFEANVQIPDWCNFFIFSLLGNRKIRSRAFGLWIVLSFWRRINLKLYADLH